MMDFLATKDTHEREEQEAERLVRPSPKVKPPRRDKRREVTRAEKDPDTDSDADTKKDPDMSLNYKTIGGSQQIRVVDRYCRDVLAAKARMISVYDKRQNRVVSIPDTRMKNDPGRYKVVLPKSKKKPAEEKPAPSEDTGKKPPVQESPSVREEKKPEAEQPASKVEVPKTEAPKADAASAKSFFDANPSLTSLVQDFSNPKSKEHQTLQSLKDLPLKKIKKYQDVDFPPGVTTLSDLASFHASRPSEETPAGAPPVETKAPSKKTKKPAPEKPAPEKPEEPGPKPSRPEFSPEEKQEILSEVVGTFPSDQARNILKLHPADQQAVLHAYKQAKGAPVEDIGAFISSVKEVYQTDPSKIDPPKTVMKDGESVPYDSLSHAEQQEAWQKHRNQVLAISASGPAILQNNYAKKGIPDTLARYLGRGAFEGHANPKDLYSQVLTEPSVQLKFDPNTQQQREVPIKSPTKTEIDRTLSSLEDSEKKSAVAYFKAQDYQALRNKYLDPSSPESIDEHMPPRLILQRLKQAVAEADAQAKLYPSDVESDIDVGADFRRRLMNRLRTLVPEKMPELQKWADNMAADDYDRDYEKWKKAVRTLMKSRKKSPEVQQEELPTEPVKPLRYYEVRKLPSGQSAAKEVQDLLSPVKVASRAYAFSTCIGSSAMAKLHERQAVYWGVEPYLDTAPYASWEQAHARDLDEADYTTLLRAASDWLKSPMLSTAVEGVVPDMQYRAALDLAIRMAKGGRYAVGLHPATYNMLLARLAGVSEKDTLVTIRSASLDSTYAAFKREGSSTELEPFSARRRTPMTMPKFASKDADRILARLDKIASTVQEKYADWGMPFETAKEITNALDKTADEIEAAAFGADSLARRQAEIFSKTAEVIQRDADEKYMDHFKNPMEPVQVEADEPYMAAYKDDQSSAVHHGQSSTGRKLAP